MNVVRVNIGVLTGWKKIKQRRISFAGMEQAQNFGGVKLVNGILKSLPLLIEDNKNNTWSCCNC
jgi:hypothetical protein